MTVEELGKRAKEKYPDEYGHLSDVEAGRQVKKENPKDYWDIIDVEEVGKVANAILTALVQVTPKELSPFDANHNFSNDYRSHQKDLERTVKNLDTYYNPNQGRLKSWWNRGKAESRTKLSEALKQETISVLERGALLEEAALRSERGRIEFQKFVAEHTVELLELKSHAYLFEIAIQKGVDKESVILINRTRYLNETDLEYQSRMADLEVHKERMISQIKLEEYAGRKKADNEAEREWHNINQDNISRFQQETQELLDRSSKRIERMYDELAELEASPESSAKEPKIARKKKDIKAAEDELDARQAKFVQDAAGQKSKRDYEDSDSVGSDREEEASGIQ